MKALQTDEIFDEIFTKIVYSHGKVLFFTIDKNLHDMDFWQYCFYRSCNCYCEMFFLDFSVFVLYFSF